MQPKPKKANNRSPGREGYPISLKPLTPEEALRRAMSVPAPNDTPASPKAKKNAAKRKKR